MKEILIRRDKENINSLVSYKVIIDNRETILIGNGETKNVLLDKIPVEVYVKLNWLKSKVVTVDSNTVELIVKGVKVKNWFDPRIIGAFILVTLIPRLILGDSHLVKVLNMVGLSILFIWAIYAFALRRNDWIIIDKRQSFCNQKSNQL